MDGQCWNIDVQYGLISERLMNTASNCHPFSWLRQKLQIAGGIRQKYMSPTAKHGSHMVASLVITTIVFLKSVVPQYIIMGSGWHQCLTKSCSLGVIDFVLQTPQGIKLHGLSMMATPKLKRSWQAMVSKMFGCLQGYSHTCILHFCLVLKTLSEVSMGHRINQPVKSLQ